MIRHKIDGRFFEGGEGPYAILIEGYDEAMTDCAVFDQPRGYFYSRACQQTRVEIA